MSDLRALTMHWRPNQCFVAPRGFSTARPHRVAASYPVPAQALYEALRAVALGEPRVSVTREAPERLRLELCQRTAICRFPDDVSAEIIPLEDGGSTLALYSRSRMGVWDLGVNRRRVARWLALLEGRVGRGGD